MSNKDFENGFILGATMRGRAKNNNKTVEYQTVEYIESTGTQYIDTGYTPNENTKLIMTLSDVVKVGGNNNNVLFSATNKWENNTFCLTYQSSGFRWMARNGNNQHFKSGAYEPKATIEFYRDFVKYNDEIMYELNDAYAYNSLDTLRLFGGARFTDPFAYQLGYRLYSLQIFENGEMIKNYVPVYHKERKEVGLFDTVSKTYLFNAGADTFLYGGVISETSDRLDHTVTFTVDGEPYEIISVKDGNSVNAPVTAPKREKHVFTGWKDSVENEVIFPYVPTSNVEFSDIFESLPTDYILYVPLRQETATAETGQALSVVGSGLTYAVVDGVECAMFNSTSEIGVSVNSDLFVQGKPFTISMWAKADSVASSTYGPKFFGFNSDFFYYQCQNAGGVHNTPGFYIGGTWALAVDTYRMTSWVHICLVYDGSQISMYNNGVSNGKCALSKNFSTSNTLYLGGNGTDPRFVNGKMSAFRVYGRALTEEEITLLSKEFSPTDR